MKKIAVILSGCGVFDGSEIHEATLTLLSIVKNQGTYDCFAPNIRQHHVINHINGQEIDQERNVLIESARIARGNIKDLSELRIDKYDALIFPGGFGAAKNLSSFAFDGDKLTILPVVKSTIIGFWKAGKPIGALCISPTIIANLIPNVKVTIGNDEATINAIKNMGAIHQNTTHGEIVTDSENKIITSPCYMLDANISQIETGVNNLVKKLFELI